MSTLYDVGNIPHKVEVVTRAGRGDTLWLRWRRDGNWKHESLRGTVRSIPRDVYVQRAHEKLASLLNQLPQEQRPTLAPLSVLEGLAIALDPAGGMFPVRTPHRDELDREVRRAAAILGNPAWATIGEGDIVALWRSRIRTLRSEGHRGHRGAEITIQRLLSVARWLRRRKHIPAGACEPPEKWKKALMADWRLISETRRDYQPERPRYTVEEMNQVLDRMREVDPRAELLFELAGDQRLGQAARARRSWLDLEAGTFTIYGAGHKRGEVLFLTPHQRAAVDRALGEGGYLRTLELRWKHDGQDYALFPGRRLLKGQAVHPDAAPVTRAGALKWHREAADLAGIPRRPGLGNYGLRRGGVDGAKAEKISREGLQHYGGWASPDIPDQVYASQEAEDARREAAAVRERVRQRGKA